MPNVFLIRVLKCDNRLVFKLNGQIVYDKNYEHNPNLKDIVDITAKLQPHPFPNVVHVEGTNNRTTSYSHHNPWEFHYEITKDNQPIVTVQDSSDGASVDGGVKLSTHHTIVKERHA